MYCSSCGRQLEEGALFCPVCGMKQNQNAGAYAGGYAGGPQGGYQGNGGGYRPYEKMKPERLRTLTVWCVIAIFWCWPIAIYGFIKRQKALKATSILEANAIVAKAITTIWIWCAVVFAIGFIYGFLGVL